MKTITILLSILLALSAVFAIPDECTKPKDPGPCRGLIPMYYYDTKTQDCEEFNHGGCEGNENQFDTYEDCVKKCKS